MKVVLVNPIGSIGGAERIVLAVMQSLRERHPESRTKLITLQAGDLLDRASSLGADVELVGLSGTVNSLGESGKGLSQLLRLTSAAPRLLLAARRLRRSIEAFEPTLVHSFGLKTHLLLGLAPPRRAQLVWHVQDFYSARTISRVFCPIAARHADKAIAISTAVAKDTRLLLPSLRTTVVENAIDLDHFAPQGAVIDLDKIAGVQSADQGTVRIGLVATYAKWKGHYAFLDAARRVLDRRPETPPRFYVIGGPIYDTAGQFTVAELTDYARSIGLGDRVVFVPFQKETASVYRALDVVVHASTQPEPFGLVIAEAMACGRAVIVSAAGGAADLFTDGVDALGHPPGDVAALAEAMSRLVEDSPLRRRLGERAVETACARFGMERYADQLRSAYASVLKPS